MALNLAREALDLGFHRRNDLGFDLLHLLLLAIDSGLEACDLIFRALRLMIEVGLLRFEALDLTHESRDLLIDSGCLPFHIVVLDLQLLERFIGLRHLVVRTDPTLVSVNVSAGQSTLATAEITFEGNGIHVEATAPGGSLVD